MGRVRDLFDGMAIVAANDPEVESMRACIRFLKESFAERLGLFLRLVGAVVDSLPPRVEFRVALDTKFGKPLHGLLLLRFNCPGKPS